MKKIDETQNESKSLANVWSKASDIGKKVAVGAQKGAKVLADKTKSALYASQMKKYNPLFPEQYQAENFHLPNMVVIVDDAVRKNISVCEGAIGWLNDDTGMEVLYLYDEWVEESGIQFIPTVNCDSAYYVDQFDRNRYIRVDCIFSKAHEEKITELEHIAYVLGAKNCSIEMAEAVSEVEITSKKQEFQSKANDEKISESLEKSTHRAISNQRSGRTVTEFQGHSNPVRPTLKWFAHEDNIARLIEMRCTDVNSIHSRTLELAGSSSATLSQSQATAIDSVINKMNTKIASSMQTQANKEYSSKLIYIIEF